MIPSHGEVVNTVLAMWIF